MLAARGLGLRHDLAIGPAVVVPVARGQAGAQHQLVKNEVLVYRQVAKAKLLKEQPAILKRIDDFYREKGNRLRPSRAVEAEPGSSVDSGGSDISRGVAAFTSSTGAAGATPAARRAPR